MSRFTETLTEYDDLIGIACTDKLSQDELKSMHTLLHERLELDRQSGLLVDLTNFEGYDSLAAQREDLKMMPRIATT